MLEADLEMVREWRNAPEVRARMYTQHEITPQEHLRWWQSKSVSDLDRMFIYEWKKKPTGFVSFYDLNPRRLSGSWAFYASPEASRGIGSRMEYLALNTFFDDLRYRKLKCEVLSSNPAVVSLHKKHGFVEEGLLRAEHPNNQGFEDIHLLAIFADDWMVRRQSIIERLKNQRQQ